MSSTEIKELNGVRYLSLGSRYHLKNLQENIQVISTAPYQYPDPFPWCT